jgi:hypothetical protein
MEPSNYQDSPVSKILHFVLSVGMLGKEQRGR